MMYRLQTRTLLTTALLACLLLASCAQKKPAPDPGPRSVRYLQVYSQGSSRVRNFTGVMRAGLESRLSFKVSGTAQEVAVNVGDQVTRGQLIARLLDTDYSLQVEEAQASLRRLEATARNARTTYDRTEALYENNNASLSDLDIARANTETANAAVRSGQKFLELAETQLSYTVLRAPMDGAISEVDLDEGENAQPGTTVAVLSSGARSEVEVSVPGALITSVRAGDAVQVTVDAIDGSSYTAHVTEVGVSATRGGSAFPVKVRLLDETPELRPGMAAEVEFRFESAGSQEVFVVPPSAIGEDQDGRFAYVVRKLENEVGTATRTDVTTGALNTNGLEVLSGLQDGDILVTAGVGRLVENETVTLWHEKAPSP